MRLRIGTLITTSGLALALGAPLQAQSMAEMMFGCYHISLDSTAAVVLGSELPFLPPPRVNLTGVESALRTEGRTTYVMRVAPGTRETVYEDQTWSADSSGRAVLLRWMLPYMGLQARLEPDPRSPDSLSGEVVRWDDHPPTFSRPVQMRLRRIDCNGD